MTLLGVGFPPWGLPLTPMGFLGGFPVGASLPVGFPFTPGQAELPWAELLGLAWLDFGWISGFSLIWLDVDFDVISI